MTDHYIQRQRPRRDLLAERTEADSLKHGDYRGEVVLYYPPTLPPTPENELYLALAQVQQGSNLAAGIPRLEQAIEKHRPARAGVLLRACARVLDERRIMTPLSGGAARRCGATPRSCPRSRSLRPRRLHKGTWPEAAQALEKAVSLRPDDGNAFADLGNVYLRQDRVDDAQKRLAARARARSDSAAARTT